MKPILYGATAAVLIVVAADAAAQGASTSSGQAYPTKPVRLIVSFPPGGATDTFSRSAAAELTVRRNRVRSWKVAMAARSRRRT